MYSFLLSLLIGGLLFTFDDGPSVKNTPQVLRILKKHKVKGVFCIPAQNLYDPRKLKIAKQIVKEGHEICNHSFSHPDFSKLSAARQWQQIRLSQRVFKKKLGIVPRLFRPPYGVQTAVMRAALIRYKLKMFMWTGRLDTRDWSPRTTSFSIYRKIIRGYRYLRKRGKTGIILFHDTHGKAVRILEKIILKIREIDGKNKKTTVSNTPRVGKRVILMT